MKTLLTGFVVRLTQQGCNDNNFVLLALPAGMFDKQYANTRSFLNSPTSTSQLVSFALRVDKDSEVTHRVDKYGGVSLRVDNDFFR